MRTNVDGRLPISDFDSHTFHCGFLPSCTRVVSVRDLFRATRTIREAISLALGTH